MVGPLRVHAVLKSLLIGHAKDSIIDGTMVYLHYVFDLSG